MTKPELLIQMRRVSDAMVALGDEYECNKCSLLFELFMKTDRSDRSYWVMTELFVMLHNGDVCKLANWQSAAEMEENSR